MATSSISLKPPAPLRFSVDDPVTIDTTNSGALNAGGAVTVTGAVNKWRPQPYAPVNALEVTEDGSVLYAGGLFKRVGPATRNLLAAFDMDNGGALMSWSPQVTQVTPVYCPGRCWPNVLGLDLSPELAVGTAPGIEERGAIPCRQVAGGEKQGRHEGQGLDERLAGERHCGNHAISSTKTGRNPEGAYAERPAK